MATFYKIEQRHATTMNQNGAKETEEEENDA